MKKAIIIEGPDNLGKTTLAAFLKEALVDESPVITHSGPPKGNGEDALKAQCHVLEVTMKSFHDGLGLETWDRSVIGECVYGPLYRQYNHDYYWVKLKELLGRVPHRLFTIVLYTNGEVYRRFRIQPKDDEKVPYQTVGEAPKIAIKFVDVVTKLDLKHTLFINCANYASFDERNKYILKRVKAWLKKVPYEHLRTDTYAHTFFNAENMIWKEGVGFLKWQYECDDYVGEFCQLGKDHKENSDFGKIRKAPTTACGAIQNVKCILVGEAP